MLLSAQKVNQLYTVPARGSCAHTLHHNTIHQLHLRLGHLHIRDILKLHKQNQPGNNDALHNAYKSVQSDY